MKLPQVESMVECDDKLNSQNVEELVMLKYKGGKSFQHLAIDGYSINGYWLFFNQAYWWLLIAILLVPISAYSINGYW